MVDYIAFGNVMLDTIVTADGYTTGREYIGGPATFAYSGIRLWTDSVMQSSRVGEDYHTLFDPWIAKNKVITEGFEVVVEHCNHSYLAYNEDGTYRGVEEVKRHRSDWIQDFGYMKTSPEQIDRWTSGGNVKGIYIALNCELVWWRRLKEIKARNGFKMVWEIEAPSAYYEYMDAVLYALESVEVFSLNIQEARTLFNIETEEEAIRELQRLPVDVTIFRVGARGLYSVTKDEVFYLPPAPSDRVVDPTGCGNTSTGASIYAYCEGDDPLMIGIKANVAAAQNVRQFGIIPDFAAVRESAYRQAAELYEFYSSRLGRVKI